MANYNTGYGGIQSNRINEIKKGRTGNFSSDDREKISDELDDSTRKFLANEVSKTKNPYEKFTGFQQKAYERILKKQDLFLVVPPAAGKTSPIISAWGGVYTTDYLNNIIKYTLYEGIPLYSMWKNYGQLNSHFNSFLGQLGISINNIPRIAYVVPRKRLAVQIAQTDFLELFYNMVENSYSSSELNKKLSPKGRKEITEMFSDFISVQESGFDPGNLKTRGLFGRGLLKPVVVGTYEPMAQVLEKYGKYFSTVIIDEFQEFSPRPDNKLSVSQLKKDSKEETINRYNSLAKIISATPNSGLCGLTLLTGSMHQDVVYDLADFFNKKFGRDFKGKGIIIEAGTPQARNRSQLVVIPFEKMASRQEKIKLIENKIQSGSDQNLMIIFSVNRKTQNGIFRILEEMLPGLPKRDPKILYGDAKEYQIDALKKQKSEETKKSEIRKQKEGYIDKNRDASMLDDDDKPDNSYTMNEIEFLKYFDINIAEQSSESDKGKKAVLKNPDPNNLLYQGVLAGVGFLIGNMHKQHSNTVQKLFKDGRIKMILATDSVGVGMNIKARHVFIPSLQKPGETGFGKVDMSSIIQMTNRGGRNPGQIPVAYIYVPQENVDELKKLLDPSYNFMKDAGLELDPIPYGEFKEYLEKGNTTGIKTTVINLLKGKV